MTQLWADGGALTERALAERGYPKPKSGDEAWVNPTVSDATHRTSMELFSKELRSRLWYSHPRILRHLQAKGLNVVNP